MKVKLREHNSTEPITDVLFHLYLITIWQDYLHIRLHLDDVISLVQFSRSAMSNSLWPRGRQQARLPYPSPTPWACSNSCPLSGWCHPTISSSVISFSFCLQTFPESESFPLSQFFASGGQSIGASGSVLSMNIRDWFPLWWTGFIPCSPRDS